MRNQYLSIRYGELFDGVEHLVAILEDNNGVEVNQPFNLDAKYFSFTEIDFGVDIFALFTDYPNVALITLDSGGILQGGEMFPANYDGYGYIKKGQMFFYDLESIRSFFSFPAVSASSSLNGDYSSYFDNSSVLCYPNNREYKVSKSYLGFASGTTLTILYDLIDDNGKKHTAPHEALTLKV